MICINLTSICFSGLFSISFFMTHKTDYCAVDHRCSLMTRSSSNTPEGVSHWPPHPQGPGKGISRVAGLWTDLVENSCLRHWSLLFLLKGLHSNPDPCTVALVAGYRTAALPQSLLRRVLVTPSSAPFGLTHAHWTFHPHTKECWGGGSEKTTPWGWVELYEN